MFRSNSNIINNFCPLSHGTEANRKMATSTARSTVLLNTSSSSSNNNNYYNHHNTSQHAPLNGEFYTLEVINYIFILTSLWLLTGFIVYGIAKRSWSKSKQSSLMINLACVGPVLMVGVLTAFSIFHWIGRRHNSSLDHDWLAHNCEVTFTVMSYFQIVLTYESHVFLWTRQRILYSQSMFLRLAAQPVVKVTSWLSIGLVSVMFVFALGAYHFQHNFFDYSDELGCVDTGGSLTSWVITARFPVVATFNVMSHVSLFTLFYYPVREQHRLIIDGVTGGAPTTTVDRRRARRERTAARWCKLSRWCLTRFACCLVADVLILIVSYTMTKPRLMMIRNLIYNFYLMANELTSVFAYENFWAILRAPLGCALPTSAAEDSSGEGASRNRSTDDALDTRP